MLYGGISRQCGEEHNEQNAFGPSFLNCSEMKLPVHNSILTISTAIEPHNCSSSSW